jgi:PKD repeat protein
MVDRKPIAEFKFTQSTVRPQVFVFDAAQSRATVGTLSKYKWLFGDEAAGAEPTMLTGPTAQHAYKAAGMFTVTLVVADDKDTGSDAVSKMVMVASVNNEGPMAKITGPSSGMPMMQLTFDGSTSTPSGDIQNYAWDFGDGQNTAGQDKTIVQHTFTAAMRYKVTLTVTDSLGVSNTAELQVAVGDVGPLAVCTWTPSAPVIGSPVSFDGRGSTAPTGSSIVIHLWTFGDAPDAGPTPGAMVQHTYSGMGPYQPTLKVIDSMNRFHETSCQQIAPGPAPICMGDYSLTANPSMQQFCGGLGTATWAGVQLHIVENTNGTVHITEMFNGMMLVYDGTWTGATFHATGTFMINNGGVDETHEVTIDGTFNTCNMWTGTYKDKVTLDFGGSPYNCGTMTWNITSMRL